MNGHYERIFRVFIGYLLGKDKVYLLNWMQSMDGRCVGSLSEYLEYIKKRKPEGAIWKVFLCGAVGSVRATDSHTRSCDPPRPLRRDVNDPLE